MAEQNLIKELIVKVITRAWTDPVYKQKLLITPKEALQDMHFPIPEDNQVRVVEEGQKFVRDDRVFTIVLPKYPANAHVLSEKELTHLAGGLVVIDTSYAGKWLD